jgi:hypothetical protein
MKTSILTLFIFVLSVCVGDIFAQSTNDNRDPGSSRGYGRPRGSGRPPDKGPKVGDMAPSFRLMSLDGKKETDLEAFRGKKPVVLFFGSYS